VAYTTLRRNTQQDKVFVSSDDYNANHYVTLLTQFDTPTTMQRAIKKYTALAAAA
jgi:ATP-dependent Clp protease adapter protein ClpS